ncbi:MAG: response regulator [Pirellulales bacterium]
MTRTIADATERAHLRVGLADDDPAARRVLGRMLRHLGHEVVFQVATGRQLVDRCHDTPADVVIADIKMPEMDGLDAADLIFEETHTPVIVLSGYGSLQFLRRAQQGHVESYLMKPATLAQLEDAIAWATRPHSV